MNANTELQPETERPKPISKQLFFQKDWFQYHIMLIPGLVLIFFMNILPMFGIVIAFKKFNPGLGIWGSPWVGLQHFQTLLDSPYLGRIIENTIVIAVSKIIVGQIVPIIFALLLNEVRKMWFKRSIQTIVYLPHFLSWVIIAGIVKEMFKLDGLVNKFVANLGYEPIMFLTSNAFFRPMLIATDVWKEFGFATIIYLAALTAINPVLYEAAEIDGASRLQKIRYVTLPGITATIVLLATLSLQNVLNAGFDQVFNLYNTLVYDSGDIIDTYVYRMGFDQLQYELAAAVGLIKSVISFFLIVIAYKLASKYANYRIF